MLKKPKTSLQKERQINSEIGKQTEGVLSFLSVFCLKYLYYESVCGTILRKHRDTLGQAAFSVAGVSAGVQSLAIFIGFAVTVVTRALARHYKWNLPKLPDRWKSSHEKRGLGECPLPKNVVEEREDKYMIGLIVAYSKNRVIGKDGQIPWRIKGEQKRFRELTTGNVVIMGRRSYEEIGRPLPNRYTIVVSNTQKFEAENCTTVGSLKEALEAADKSKNIYISGGAGLYKEAIDIVDKMFITEIDAVVEGDTYFPQFDEVDFIKEVDCHVDGDLPYDYVTYTRKR